MPKIGGEVVHVLNSRLHHAEHLLKLFRRLCNGVNLLNIDTRAARQLRQRRFSRRDLGAYCFG